MSWPRGLQVSQLPVPRCRGRFPAPAHAATGRIRKTPTRQPRPWRLRGNEQCQSASYGMAQESRRQLNSGQAQSPTAALPATSLLERVSAACSRAALWAKPHHPLSSAVLRNQSVAAGKMSTYLGNTSTAFHLIACVLVHVDECMHALPRVVRFVLAFCPVTRQVQLEQAAWFEIVPALLRLCV